MPEINYKKEIEKIITTLEEYKSNPEHNLDEIDKKIQNLTNQKNVKEELYNKYVEMAHIAASTNDSFADQMNKTGDERRRLEKQIKKEIKNKENVEKTLEKNQKNLDKYTNSLEEKHSELDKDIKEKTKKITELNKRIKELRRKEDRTEDERKELIELISDREKIKIERKELGNKRLEYKKALDVIKAYKEQGIVPKKEKTELALDKGADKPGQGQPEQSKPEQPKSEQQKPEQPKPEGPKPEQPKPEQPKPEGPKPEQSKPVQQKPEGPKPEQSKPVQQKTERLVPEISQINLDEEANWIEVLDKAGNVIFTENMRSYKIRKNMSEEFKERLGKRCKEVKEEIGKNKYKGIDERVLMLLEDMGTEDMIAQYVKSIAEKKAEMPFSIEYNLKNIYKDKKYTLDGIKQINKWAKIAKKQNKDKVYVDKDKLLKRALDNLRFKKEKGLLLPAPLKEIHPISETKEMLSKGKEVIPEKVKEVASKGKEVVERGRETLIQKGKDVKHFTSKKIDNLRNCNAKQFGRETWGTLKIMGAKTLGYIRRENPLVTQMRVNQIREKSFTERLKENVHVDEEVAIKKVEASKAEAKNQEVAIENPDGTKVAATRLWSRDD